MCLKYFQHLVTTYRNGYSQLRSTKLIDECTVINKTKKKSFPCLRTIEVRVWRFSSDSIPNKKIILEWRRIPQEFKKVCMKLA